MASIAKLVVSLSANTGAFETNLKRASSISKTEMRKMERQSKQLRDKWDKNFRMAGLAVAGGLALATKSAIDFEKAMGEVSTLLDDTSGLDNLAKGVKKVSVEFGQSPIDEAKALYQIISAGASDAATQMEQLTVANKLAVGGVTSVATAADGLTTVLNAYAADGLSAEYVSDILFTTMKGGKTTVEELAQGIGNVATIAAQTGVEFDQLGAAVATLTKSGISTSSAMDSLRGVLSAVLKQSDQSVKMARTLGVEFNITALKAKGLHQFLADIANTGATAEQLAKLFGRVEGLNAVMALGAQDGAEFTRQLGEMEMAAGATDVAVDKMMSNTAFKAAQAQAAFHTLGIEIGQNFLASVSHMAELFVKNFDSILFVVEALVQLLTIRLGVMGVRAMILATTTATGFAGAMAMLGGPIGAIALALGSMYIGFQRIQTIMEESNKDVAKSTTLMIGLADALDDVADAAKVAALAQDLASKYKDIGEQVAALSAEYVEQTRVLLDLERRNLTTTRGYKAHIEKMEQTELAYNNARKVQRAYGKELKDVTTKVEKATKATEGAADTIEDMADASDEAAKQLEKLVEELEAADKEAEDFADSLQSILDRLYPLQAEGRRLADDLAILTQKFDTGTWTVEGYEDAVRRATDAFTGYGQEAVEAAKQTDLMTTAIDESVRILERAFTDMWSNLLDGSQSAFDSIKSGFKSLIANLIHQATTQKITLNIQQGLAGTGTGPGGGINWQQLGGDLAAFAGIIAGSELGGSGTGATIGAAIGSIAGTAAVAALSGTWLALGAVGGPIGIAVAAILGGLIGGLFDKDRPPEFNAAGTGSFAGLSKSDDEQLLKTILGSTFISSRRIDAAAIQDVMAGISQFDEALGSFIGGDQLTKVVDALKGWNKHLSGEAITLETLLASRFSVILSTFAADVQGFVRSGSDLAAQMDRLQVAVAAADVIGSSDLFSGRTVGEFLTVVEAFQDGTETITDAFNEVLDLLNMVVAVTTSLRDFASSDLNSDFLAVLQDSSITLTEALGGMNSALMDAIAGFNGSPEQLQNIGLIASSVREGELKLLAQIDSIQKGLNANLEQLKNDLLGITAPAKTGQELFADAKALLGSIGSATGPAQIAALGQQFEAIIRPIAPEDQTSMQSDLVALVESFQTASNAALELQRQTVLDNAAAMRDLVDVFLNDIGDPLAIIAASNQQAADALSQISGSPSDAQADQAVEDRESMALVMDDGLDDISNAVGSIGPIVASAVRSAVLGVNVIVNVSVSDSDLVNE